MNKNETIKKLKEDIQDVYSIVNQFENTNKFHQIDLDLALSKVRNLYELFLKFNSEVKYTSEYQKEETSIITKPESTEIIKKPKATTESQEKDVTKVIPKKEAPKTKEAEFNTDKEPIEPISEPEFIIETPSKKEIISETKSGKGTSEIVADKFHSKEFVNDNIGKNGIKNDVSTKMQSKPIKDISNAIGLNDKFIFIRELFGNDKEHYNETILVLNNFDTFENALDFLNTNFDWDKDDENFIRLTELVRRKYM